MNISKSGLLLLLKTDYMAFCQCVFLTLNAGNPLSNDPYVKVICSRLANIVNGDGTRLIINMPPRHAKTLLATVCLAAWWLGHNPHLRILIVCYGEDLAHDIAYNVSSIVEHFVVSSCIPVSYCEGSDAGQ